MCIVLLSKSLYFTFDILMITYKSELLFKISPRHYLKIKVYWYQNKILVSRTIITICIGAVGYRNETRYLISLNLYREIKLAFNKLAFKVVTRLHAPLWPQKTCLQNLRKKSPAPQLFNCTEYSFKHNVGTSTYYIFQR